MFQFPRCPRAGLCVQPAVTSHDGGRVAPFGDPRISLLGGSPRRFVALPRPSSAPSAEASTARLYSAWPVPGPALRRVCGATCVSAARACDSGCVCLVGWLVGWCWSPCHPADTRPAGRPEGVCLWLVVWFVGGWFCVRPLRVMAKPCDRPGHHLTAWRAWQRQAPACHAVPTAQLSCLALRRFAVRRVAALDLLYCLLRTIFSW